MVLVAFCCLLAGLWRYLGPPYPPNHWLCVPWIGLVTGNLNCWCYPWRISSNDRSGWANIVPPLPWRSASVAAAIIMVQGGDFTTKELLATTPGFSPRSWLPSDYDRTHRPKLLRFTPALLPKHCQRWTRTLCLSDDFYRYPCSPSFLLSQPNQFNIYWNFMPVWLKDVWLSVVWLLYLVALWLSTFMATR